jgi:glycosyltransferase involved in cell wall biosynthesis
MRERPRVLHMGPDPAIGGGMAAALRALLDSPLASSYELDVVPTYRAPATVRRVTLFCLALTRLTIWSLRGRGRIVHVHATVRGSMYRKSVSVLLAKMLRRRVVLHVHSGAGDIAEFRAGLGRLSLRLFGAAFVAADAVLAVSARSAEALAVAYSVPAPAVVPNPAPPVEPVTRSVPPPGRARIVYLGGFANPAKGGDVMLSAIESLLAHAPGVELTLAGPGSMPPSGASLVAAHDGISWAGWLERDERDELLRSAHILVMPSRSEGLPMALLEGMSFGIAIVATAVGGIPEVVETEVEALLVPPEDPLALADGLLALLGDPELIARLGEAARARAGELDAVEVAGRLEALYASLA